MACNLNLFYNAAVFNEISVKGHNCRIDVSDSEDINVIVIFVHMKITGVRVFIFRRNLEFLVSYTGVNPV